MLWHDEDWCRETAERINKLDIEGCIVHINTQWGHKGHIGAHTASRNITRVLEQLSPEVLAGNSEQDFQNFFGDTAGPVILEAAKNLAAFPLDMTTAVHLLREGFSFGMPPWFDGHWRWPGVLGSPKYRPPEWLESEGITDIYELIQSVAQEPESYSRVMKRTEGTAFTLCDNIAERCERAVELLENCPEPSSLPAKSELRALMAGAHIAILAAREHGAVLRARLAWEAVKCLPDKSTECEKARECAVKWYEQAVEALNRQIPRALDMAMVYPDVMHHVVSSRETINRLTMATRLRVRREELRRIKTVTGPEWADAMTVEFWPHLPHTIGSGARR